MLYEYYCIRCATWDLRAPFDPHCCNMDIGLCPVQRRRGSTASSSCFATPALLDGRVVGLVRVRYRYLYCLGLAIEPGNGINLGIKHIYDLH